VSHQSGIKHCVVLGGGVAGVTAAVRLVERGGWRVTLVEARAQLGGRVQSLHDQTTDEVIDNGQHLLMGCYTSTLRLAETLGTMPILRRQPALQVWFADCTVLSDEAAPNPNPPLFALDASSLSGILPAQFAMGLGLMRLHGLTIREKYAIMRFAVRLLFNRIETNGKTTREFLHLEHQSERVIERLWEPIILATLNAPVSQASATLFATVLQLAFFAGGDAAQMILAETGLAEMLAPATAWLSARGSSVIHAKATCICLENSRAVGVGILDSSSKHHILAADTVVSALPAAQLLKILPEHHTTSTTASTFGIVPSSAITSVYLWFDREFMEQDFIALLGTTVQWVFNRRKLCTAKHDVAQRFPCHLSLTVSAATKDLAVASSNEIVALCLRDLLAAFPASRTATLLHSRVIRERHATPLFTPDNEHLRPNTSTPLEVLGISSLFLAGDWTNTGLPATIESAARSGEMAAEAVCKQ
jgi:hydroxysqualene dehydroxylase